MKKPFLHIFFLFTIVSVFSQSNSIIDSLQQLIPNATDEKKIELFNEIAKTKYFLLNETDEEIIDNAIDLSQISGNKASEAKSLITKGLILSRVRSLSETQAYFDKAISIATEINDSMLLADALTQKGGIYLNKSRFKEAQIQYEYALQVYKQLNYNFGIARLHNNIGYTLLSLGEFSKALSHFQEGLNIIKVHEDVKLLPSLYVNLGIVYYETGNYDFALFYLNKSLEYFFKVDNRLETYLYLGKVYQKTNDWNKAFDYYFDILEKSNELNIPYFQGQALLNLGILYSELSDFDKALSYCNNSLIIFTQHSFRLEEADAYRALGNIYIYSQRYDAAKNFYLQAENIYREFEAMHGIAAILNNYGIINAAIGDYSEALINYQQSLDLKYTLGNKNGIANSLLNIGFVYKYMNDFPQAIRYFQESKSIFEEIDNCRGASQSLSEIGAVYKNQGNLELAANFLILSNESCDSLLIKDVVSTNYKSLSDIYFKQGDYKQAYLYFQKYDILEDSINTENQKNTLAEFQARFETENKERQIELKEFQISESQKKIERQQTQLILISGLLVLTIILISVFFYQLKLIKTKNRKIENINAQLDSKVRERTKELRITQFSVDNASIPIFWINEKTEVIYANESARNLLEYSSPEILSLKIQDIDIEINGKSEKTFNDIRLNKTILRDTVFQKKNRILIPVETVINYLKIEDVEYAFVFSIDISNRKRYEEDLKNAKIKAEESDKLKTAFLANMSHEIRTPMNAIIGFSDLLREPEIDDLEKLDLLELIKQSGDDLLHLIDDIIDISMIEAGQMKINMQGTDIRTIMNDRHRFYTEFINRESHKDLKINLVIEDNLVLSDIKADGFRFKQIINNLLHNAIKFTEQGVITLSCKLIDNHLQFAVQDSGIGLTEEQQAYIFERFRKAEESKTKIYRGTGLGLAITKSLVELMGGKIWVESQKDVGSKFTFTLPNVHSKLSVNETKKTNQQKTKFFWSKKHILIVEDVHSNYYYLETVLRHTQAKVTWAQSGIDALNMIKSGEIFDAILMDIQLPDHNGLEITKIIRELNIHTPVIAQTAYALSDEKEKSLAAGCNDYISKPIQKQALLNILSNYLS